MTSRRTFVSSSALGLGALALGSRNRLHAALPLTGTDDRSEAERSAPLNILILGGTGFIGPYQVRYAVERGHKVTVFNRGRRQAELPSSVEHLTGDRDTGNLEVLKGRSWDVVI